MRTATCCKFNHALPYPRYTCPHVSFWDRYFPPKQKSTIKTFSQSVIGFLAGLVLALVFACFAIRAFLVNEDYGGFGAAYGAAIGSFLNACQIMVMEVLYKGMARWLNDYENFATDTAYEDALITKTWAFQVSHVACFDIRSLILSVAQFINSYSSLFYLAFVQQFYDKGDLKCKGSTCVSKLSMSLFIVMWSKWATAFSKEVVKPYAMNVLKRCLADRKQKKLLQQLEKEAAAKGSEVSAEELEMHLSNVENRSPAEVEFRQIAYSMIHDNIEEYFVIAQQYG